LRRRVCHLLPCSLETTGSPLSAKVFSVRIASAPSNQSLGRTHQPSPEMNPGMEGFSTRRSSCLLFQMFGVETNSFLPDEQSDRGHLACQRESRHVRLHASGSTSFVEIPERPSRGSRLSSSGIFHRFIEDAITTKEFAAAHRALFEIATRHVKFAS